jgi:hypothetical protein
MPPLRVPRIFRRGGMHPIIIFRRRQFSDDFSLGPRARLDFRTTFWLRRGKQGSVRMQLPSRHLWLIHVAVPTTELKGGGNQSLDTPLFLLLEPHFGWSRENKCGLELWMCSPHKGICLHAQLPTANNISHWTQRCSCCMDRQRKRSGHQLQSNQLLQKRVCGAAGGCHLCSRVTALFPYSTQTGGGGEGKECQRNHSATANVTVAKRWLAALHSLQIRSALTETNVQS